MATARRCRGGGTEPLGRAERFLGHAVEEIMGGRIAVSEFDATVPKSLKYAVIGTMTAREIRLLRD